MKVRLNPRWAGTAVAALALSTGACSNEPKSLDRVLCEEGYQQKPDSNDCERIPHIKCNDGWVLREDPENGHYCVRQEDFVKRTIHGIVYSGDNYQPLAGVEIYALGFQEAPVTTDERGYYKFEGVAPKGNVVLYLKKAGYKYTTDSIELGDVGSEQGGFLYEYNFSLYPEDRTVALKGTVYAGDVPANNAQVQLYDLWNGRIAYNTTTGAEGRFTFDAVIDGRYSLRVAPLDQNGDGVLDFRMASQTLPDPLSGSNATNVTNLVVSMEPFSRNVLYSNLYDSSNNRLRNVGPTSQSNLRLASPNSNVILHFSDRMQTGSLVAELWEVETNVNPKRLVKQLTMNAAWSNGDTVLTFDPAEAFAADADSATQYMIRVRSLQWADGTWFIHPTTGANTPWELTFDVADLPDYLPIPTPTVYLSNDEGATTGTFDAQQCFLRNASGGRVTEWNSSSGFTLSWQHVAGAKNYAIYARHLNGFARDHANVGWRRVVDNVSAASGTIDPNLNPTIWTTGVLANWTNFGFPSQLLAYGNKVQFAVVPKDAAGYEAAIDPTKALEIRDTQQAGVGPSYDYDYDTMYSSSGELEIELPFSELMATAVAPEIVSVSSQLGIRDNTAQFSWGDNQADENASNWAYLKMVVTQTGSCARVDTDLIYRSEDPTRSDKSFVVSDIAPFQANGEALFLQLGAYGANEASFNAMNQGERVEIDAVTASTRVVTLRTQLKASVYADNWSYACSYTGAPTLATSSNTGSLTVRVSSADKFMPGQWVVLKDPTVSGQAAYIRQVVRVRTDDKELDLSDFIPVSLNAGSTRVMFLPTHFWLGGLRPVQQPNYGGFLTTVAGDNTRAFTSGELDGTLVAKGDRLFLDADGDITTKDDQAIGTVSSIRVKPDEASNPRRDELTVSGLTAGLTLVKDRSLVLLLGDELRVANAAQLKDTSNNTGLLADRDEFSVCYDWHYDWEGNQICSSSQIFAH